MFGLSLTKLLITALIIFGVWYAFRWINRMGQAGAARARERVERAAKSQPEPIADMERCAVCGDFVLPNLTAGCGRPSCPFVARK